MAYDEGMAQILRDDLAGDPGITERRMFGGLCFMKDGNMLCGVHKGGAMFRVGKERHAQALAIDGVTPMAFTGRPMGGLVDVDTEASTDDTRRAQLMALALAFIATLPSK